MCEMPVYSIRGRLLKIGTACLILVMTYILRSWTTESSIQETPHHDSQPWQPFSKSSQNINNRMIENGRRSSGTGNVARGQDVVREDMIGYSDELTVVTAYINIGSFQKGHGGMTFTPALYRHWMSVFSSITNPVIAYMDNQEDINYFLKVRSKLSQDRTLVIKVNTTKTWAFTLIPKIEDIVKQDDYPKYSPNTVIPEYSCIMHAKYEFMLNATKTNPFSTKYFSWLDIGLFRDLTDTEDIDPFSLWLPTNFDVNKVAYSQVILRNSLQNSYNIFRGNMVWVCGCYFIARTDTMEKWTRIYMTNVEYYLGEGLTNTDQQVIYSMINDHRSSIDIQVYKGTGSHGYWFDLGYLSRKAGIKLKKQSQIV